MDPKKLQTGTYSLKWTQPYPEWMEQYNPEFELSEDPFPEARKALSKYTLHGL